MDQIKFTVVIALSAVACALCVFLAIYTSKAKKDLADGQTDVASRVLSIVRYIVVAIAAVAGAVISGATLTSCKAARSITVQATVVHSTSPDSARVIISTQETYTGIKKK